MDSKPWWQSKTVWFGLLMVLVSIANLFGYADWQPTQEELAVILGVVGLVQILLRLVTKQPIAK